MEKEEICRQLECFFLNKNITNINKKPKPTVGWVCLEETEQNSKNSDRIRSVRKKATFKDTKQDGRLN